MVSTAGALKFILLPDKNSTLSAVVAVTLLVMVSLGAAKFSAVGKLNVPETFLVNSGKVTVSAVMTEFPVNSVNFGKFVVSAVMVVADAVVKFGAFKMVVSPLAETINVPVTVFAANSILPALGA